VCSHAGFAQADKQRSISAGQPVALTASSGNQAFDPFLPRQVAEKLFVLDNVYAKTTGLSRLASLIWKYDEDYARLLFEKALAATTPQGNGDDARLRMFQRSIISVIAKKDPEWARRLIDAQPTLDANNRNAANLNTALALIEENPTEATAFAQRALSEQLNPSFLHFLLTMRKADQARADQMFLQALGFLSQQQRPDIKALHLLGVYLFSAANLLDSDNYALTRVDNIIVPNISAQRPDMSPALVRAYLTTAGSLLLRAATDAEQQQVTYALGRLLLVKARVAAPDLVSQFEAGMAAVSSSVPGSLTSDSAYKYIDSTPPTLTESLANAARNADPEARDISCLDIAAAAWRKADFTTVRKAGAMMQNAEASRSLALLADFGEAASVFKNKSATNVITAERTAYKLSPGLERAILLLVIAQHRVKSGNNAKAEEAIDASLRAAAAVSDLRRPYLSMIGAGYLAQLQSSRTPAVTAGTIRDLNSFESANFAAVEWSREVEVGALKANFSLAVAGLDVNLDAALRAIFLSDLEAGFTRAQELKNEGLRSRALVEFVAAYLEKTEKDSGQGPLPIRVGEDGMRKSASKTVMPEYPQDALKKQQKGPAIVEVQYDGQGEVTDVAVLQAPATSIGDAVVHAVRQWRFTPSKDQNGKPVSIRGKLTFYFLIDAQGKGRVENPKQFR
jgi:TonB family protein